MAFNPYKFSWRYVKSFFKPEVWQRESTPYNPFLEVVYDYGKIKLNSETVNYSFGSLHVAFAETFANFDIRNRDIKNVLILGLGAGSIPAILAGYQKDYQMVGVEIDEVVIELAKKYFNLDYHKNLKIIIADAVDYILSDEVQLASQKFDLIAIDLFIDYEVPIRAEADFFLTKLGNLLSNNGILIYNRLAIQSTIESSDNFRQTFQRVFPSMQVFNTYLNSMLVYDKAKEE